MNSGLICVFYFPCAVNESSAGDTAGCLCCSRGGLWAPLGTSGPSTACVPHARSSRSTQDTLTPETSACLNQTQVRPYLKILGNHFHWGVFTSALIPRTKFDRHLMRTLTFISDVEQCGWFGSAMAWLCWGTSTALAALSQPFLCTGPGAFPSHGQHGQHTGMVLQREAGQSQALPFCSLYWLPRSNCARESTATPPPGVSSFTTASWLLWPLTRMQ